MGQKGSCFVLQHYVCFMFELLYVVEQNVKHDFTPKSAILKTHCKFQSEPTAWKRFQVLGLWFTMPQTYCGRQRLSLKSVSLILSNALPGKCTSSFMWIHWCNGMYWGDMDSLSIVTQNRHRIHEHVFDLLAVKLEIHEDRYHLPRIWGEASCSCMITCLAPGGMRNIFR